MTPERYERVRELFLAARDQPLEQRDAFLHRECGPDECLRSEVESLLANDALADTFLQTPALGGSFALHGPESIEAHGPGGQSERRSQASATNLTPALPPQRIGQYRILGVLGQGGMGVVYRAEQENPRRSVALKVVRPGAECPGLFQRFQHESEVLGSLHHPGIAQIYEAGTGDAGHGPQPFFAMELIHGQPLTAHAAAYKLDIRARLALLAKVCDAVHHAHQKGVIHRDLKPGNILVDENGQPKVVDFGVARATDADIRTATTCTDVGQLIGTIAYMSPEQLAGDARELDTRSDVYALGVIGYELLTGRIPLDITGKTIPEAARLIAEADPPPLSTLDRALRGDTAAIIAKALEKDKNQRYQSASDLAADIRRYLSDQPVSARPITTFYQLRKLARRNRALVGGIAAAVLALCGGVAGTSYGLVHATSQRRAAETERNRAVAAEHLAEQRRAAAQTEALKVQTINDFISGMLASPDPGREGRDVRVVDVLKCAADELDTKLADQPEIRAALRNTLGVTYLGLGQFAEAEPQLRAALATCAELLAQSTPTRWPH